MPVDEIIGRARNSLISFAKINVKTRLIVFRTKRKGKWFTFTFLSALTLYVYARSTRMVFVRWRK